MAHSGTVTINADEYLALLDKLQDLENKLRSLGHQGFTTSQTIRPPSETSREKVKETGSMELKLDISGIDWRKSNRDGGGPAEPNDGWAWSFGFTKDGGIRPENVKLIQAIEQYGKVNVGQYEITLGGRDGRLLNRKKLSYRGR